MRKDTSRSKKLGAAALFALAAASYGAVEYTRDVRVLTEGAWIETRPNGKFAAPVLDNAEIAAIMTDIVRVMGDNLREEQSKGRIDDNTATAIIGRAATFAAAPPDSLRDAILKIAAGNARYNAEKEDFVFYTENIFDEALDAFRHAFSPAFAEWQDEKLIDMNGCSVRGEMVVSLYFAHLRVRNETLASMPEKISCDSDGIKTLATPADAMGIVKNYDFADKKIFYIHETADSAPKHGNQGISFEPFSAADPARLQSVFDRKAAIEALIENDQQLYRQSFDNIRAAVMRETSGPAPGSAR